MRKDFPVFDCDAHLTTSPDLWNYLSSKEKELVKPWFWPDGDYVILNENACRVEPCHAGPEEYPQRPHTTA